MQLLMYHNGYIVIIVPYGKMVCGTLESNHVFFNTLSPIYDKLLLVEPIFYSSKIRLIYAGFVLNDYLSSDFSNCGIINLVM